MTHDLCRRQKPSTTAGANDGSSRAISREPIERYAYWLDGEFLRQAQRRAQWTLSQAETVLKLYALFGYRLALSDIQLIDSPVLQQVFADAAFVHFVEEHPDLLALHGRTQDGVPDLALNGLARATRPQWISSSLSDETPIVALSERLLGMELGDLRAEDWQRNDCIRGILRRWPEHAPALRGILVAVRHFLTSGVQRSARGETGAHYYGILERVLEKDLHGDDRALLERTKATIDALVPEESRPFRSVIQRAVEADPERSEILGSVVVAWNAAVAESLGVAGASLSHLEGAADIPIYLDRPDSSVATSMRELLLESLAHVPEAAALMIPWNVWSVRGLSWEGIRRIVEETAETRFAIQNADASGDTSAREAAHEAHLRALSRVIEPVRAGAKATLGFALCGVIGALSGKAEVAAVAAGLPALPILRQLARRSWVYTTLKTAHRVHGVERALA